jgi:ribose transport system permease protein
MSVSDYRAEAPPEEERQRVRHRYRSQLGHLSAPYSGLFVWAAVIVAFGIWVPDTFLTLQSLRTISESQAVTAIVALALIAPTAAGAFDLSVAATMGIGLLVVLRLQAAGWNSLLAVLVALLCGLAVGIVNAIAVVKFEIDSFIATLGMSSILAALSYEISGGSQLIGGTSSVFNAFGQKIVYGVPLVVLYMLGVAAILFYISEYTTLGRHVYATGGNKEAARLAGIRVNRVIVGSLIASGVIAAFAGVVLAASLGTATYDTGPPYLLPAFSAVFLGATQIKLGRINVVGTLIAVYLLATGIKGLTLVGAPVWLPDLFNGAVLIIAVGLAVRGRRRR